MLKSFIEYFYCGNYYLRYTQDVGDFIVTKFVDINEKIGKYPIYGVKDLDYKDICKIGELMKNKAHLTTSGLEQLRLEWTEREMNSQKLLGKYEGQSAGN